MSEVISWLALPFTGEATNGRIVAVIVGISIFNYFYGFMAGRRSR